MRCPARRFTLVPLSALRLPRLLTTRASTARRGSTCRRNSSTCILSIITVTVTALRWLLWALDRLRSPTSHGPLPQRRPRHRSTRDTAAMPIRPPSAVCAISTAGHLTFLVCFDQHRAKLLRRSHLTVCVSGPSFVTCSRPLIQLARDCLRPFGRKISARTAIASDSGAHRARGVFDAYDCRFILPLLSSSRV